MNKSAKVVLGGITKIIADGVVHAVGICLGLIAVTIIAMAVKMERRRADLGLRHRPRNDARTLGGL